MFKLTGKPQNKLKTIKVTYLNLATAIIVLQCENFKLYLYVYRQLKKYKEKRKRVGNAVVNVLAGISSTTSCFLPNRQTGNTTVKLVYPYCITSALVWSQFQSHFIFFKNLFSYLL